MTMARRLGMGHLDPGDNYLAQEQIRFTAHAYILQFRKFTNHLFDLRR
jgi:hypothetical protein